VENALFTFNYSSYSRRLRGVYLPLTITAETNAANLILRVDSASTYCVLERSWADYFNLSWEDGDPIRIGTVTGGFQAFIHILELQIDQFYWQAPIAIAEFESVPGIVQRNVLGLTGFFDRFRVTIDDQSEIITIQPQF